MGSKDIVRQVKAMAAAGENRYSWAPGTQIGVAPETAMEEFRGIYEEMGAITPTDVLARAQPVGSVLHREFEWRNALAAEQYRLGQASHLLRSLVVTVKKAEGTWTQPVRAVVSVARRTGNALLDEEPSVTAPRVYIPVVAALSERDTRERLLLQAVRELQVFRKRYRDLGEFSKLFREVSEVEQLARPS